MRISILFSKLFTYTCCSVALEEISSTGNSYLQISSTGNSYLHVFFVICIATLMLYTETFLF